MTLKDTGLYIELENLKNFAYSTAKMTEPSGTVSGAKTAEGVYTALRKIKNITTEATAFASDIRHVPQEIEWLLDNWYIAEREGKDAAFHIKRAGRLPAAEKKDTPAAAKAANALVRSGRGEITEERLRVYLDGFQNYSVLSEKELALFIPLLKAELVFFLEDACLELQSLIRGGDVSPDLAFLMGNVFTSLRFLSNFDASEILEGVNRIEAVLASDPAGIYPQMDEKTRFYYRREISKLAEKNGISEYEAAERAVELAKAGDNDHVGTYIFTKPLGKSKRRSNGGIYISTIVISSLFLTILMGILFNSPVVSLLLIFPVSEIMKNIVDFIAVKAFKPKLIPKLELENGVPEEGRTICVISALLSSKESVAHCAGLLEEYKLSNRDTGKNLVFGILGDLPEADDKIRIKDAEIIGAATEEIEKLNTKYGGGFYFFCRERVFSKTCSKYMAWERKRGAILELVRMLSGKNSSLKCCAGSKLGLEGIRFIITLDSDTRLCAGSAAELIGAALHPLNTPVVDAEKRIVVSGSGIIQPRISVDLNAANRSDFTKIFAGQGGIDPYGSAASDVYQDLFSEGSFTGKGILNVRAYEECLDGRFPEDRVLSHDLLEGAYLHCAYMGETEFTDGYPYKVTSYYDRMHRWTRGDWQNIGWLTSKVKNAAGEKERNPLGDVSKWKIFDNLRRSLVPVFTFLALVLGMLFSNKDFVLTGSIAVLSALSALLISSAELVFRRDPGTKTRYHSTIISGFAGGLMQTAIRLMLLPYEAWICFSAIVSSLYRLFISHKNMLSWVTAADSESISKNTVYASYYKMWPCAVFGLAIILLSPYAAAVAVGIVWLFTPLYAYSLSREIRSTKAVSNQDKNFLLAAAGDIWRYFEDFLTPEDNFLPPDNWQEQPAVGIAHRTSPTNIGLAMLSALAALDLGVTTKQKALGAVENILTTVERLPKWNGHLYNWYDTRTLKSLEPKYVSTVDNGNFVGSLIALREGLLELGETKLAKRVQDLTEEMSFKPLFDKKRKLFYIGWDVASDKPTEGWYDLMASEARQTSYIAIARGDVTRKHWRRLGRALVVQDNYSGMASWTGTMFEYLMPNLILPCYKNSLIYESSKFCVYAQKRRDSGIPWGVSESAFYSFDPALNYRYKAHGVQRLALKRKMGTETVISPYSTFLALSVDLKGAVKNLRRLRKLRAEGRYGFYEAVDFTPNRQTDAKYEIVRTFMAHHLGMSILAVDNALNDDIMPKRFMRDREMGAFAELLQEKVPVGEVVLRQPPREVPEKPMRAESKGWHAAIDGVDALSPQCVLLSNGAYSVLMTETGQTRSAWNGMELTRFSPVLFDRHAGMAFWLKVDQVYLPITASPDFDPTVQYSSLFDGNRGVITAEKRNLVASLSVEVPPDEMGELRRIQINYAGDEEIKGEILCYLEPVLEKKNDFEAHPSFSKLALEMKRQGNSVTVNRRDKGYKRGNALCLSCSLPATYETSKQKVFGRGDAIEFAADNSERFFDGASPEACVFARADITLKPGQTSEVRFALAAAQEESDACEAAERILDFCSGENASRLDRMAFKLGMKPADVDKAMALITDILFVADERKRREEDILKPHGGQNGLWQFGVSGDLPIVTADIKSEEDLDLAGILLKEHTLLTQNGLLYDLVLLLHDGSDYRRPVRMAITDILRGLEWENMCSAFGGVHLIEAESQDTSAVFALSSRVLDRQSVLSKRIRKTDRYPERPKKVRQNARDVECHFQEDGSFVFRVFGKLPENAWSNMLANDTFGYVATDAGTGHMWHKNARENKINRWLNDSLTTEGTEKLHILKDGKKVSLFADEDGCECRVTYGFGYASWEKEIDGQRIKTTAFVPAQTAARVLMIEADKKTEGAAISYFTDLVLGADEAKAPYIVTELKDGILEAFNTSNTEFPDDKFFVLASENLKEFSTDKSSFLTGRMDGALGAGMLPCIGAVYPFSEKLVIVVGCDGVEELKKLAGYAAAQRELEKTTAFWTDKVRYLTIQTPDHDLDRYMNGWALYQTLACRIKGRSSIYQSGGAFGFRDQLQDACAILETAPEDAERLLLRAAAHQYEEGDVQHWWHPGTAGTEAPDKGVRTRCSDDLLWLPYTLCEYVDKTGNRELCDTEVSYIASPPLAIGEDERYEHPQKSDVKESVLLHAVRAVDAVLQRGTGLHGLCFIGTCDWNDGMNLIGANGQGESVWLTWFAVLVLNKMALLCEKQGMPEKAEHYKRQAESLKAAADNAWDGNWYLRGYYDDQTPLGSASGEECAIDSIAQSFAVFAGGSREKTETGLKNAYDMLFDRSNKLIKLFDPPFADGQQMPGYIKGYCPGFRENGGQYTHGAIWLAKAFLDSGEAGKGYEMLHAMLPATHDLQRYKAEPYVISADVYSNPYNMGRGGWTWYTGAAGWYYRVAKEDMLGIKVRDNRLYIEPNLPASWKGYEAVYRSGDEVFSIRVRNENGVQITVNEMPYQPEGYGLKINNNFISCV